MSDRKLSDWLASNHFEDYAAAARALEERAEAAETEVARLRNEMGWREDIAGDEARIAYELSRENDALRANLEKARSVLESSAADSDPIVEAALAALAA